jgi:hypothetical protein
MGGLDRTKPDADTKKEVEDKYGDIFKDFQKEITKAFVDAVRKAMQENNEGAGEGGEAGGAGKSGKASGASGGKASSGSWLQAIAKAMGEVMGQKASRMVQLSEQIQAHSSAGAEKAKNGQVSDGDKMKDASDAQKLNTEFQATSQEFNLLQNTFSTAVKTMGEGMASIARKQ